ncbi:MAG: 4Fe-4S dicluster domain-containing protein [Planctomycetota bacterium]
MPATEVTPTYGFIIDNRRCIGCHACTVACKAEHGDPVGVQKTWVQYVDKGIFPEAARAFHVLRCNHCAEAPCVEICPTASLFARADGIVDFDPSRCVGCKACMQACPYDAITIDPRSGTATKCNYCAHRVDGGREPACSVVCPTSAILAGDTSPNGAGTLGPVIATERVAVRKPEKGTRPKLYYIEGDAAALDPSAAFRDGRTLWGSRAADGVDGGLDGHTPHGAARAGAADDHRALATVPATRGAPRRSYDIPQRHAGSWGWKVGAYLFTKSIAAGAFLVPALFAGLAPAELSMERALALGAPLALVALLVTGILLVADLRRPARFLWVMLRPQWHSWLVRGAYIIAAYGLVLLICCLAPGIAGGMRAATLLWTGGILAAMTAAYSGWLFGQAKGRDLWQSALSPIHLLVQALVAGSGALLIVSPRILSAVETALALLLALDAALVLLEVHGRHASADAARAARILRRGRRGWLLWLGVIAAGRGLAILLLLAGAPGGPAVAGLLALAGVLLWELLWVDAPQRLPLA